MLAFLGLGLLPLSPLLALITVSLLGAMTYVVVHCAAI